MEVVIDAFLYLTCVCFGCVVLQAVFKVRFCCPTQIGTSTTLHTHMVHVVHMVRMVPDRENQIYLNV